MNKIQIDQSIIDTAQDRNYSTNLVKSLDIPQNLVDKRFEYYYSIPQPPQKSQAWLDQRTNYITASTFGHAIAPKWKSYRNELLKNKVSKGSYNTFFGNEATRWGEKFEDVCTAVYCYRNDVQVFEFGLIPHPKYPFLGASTDGITSKLINLEIKSPFSRVIQPGKVKDLYWKQMQLQMAVLDLNLSHFLECSFKEYPSEYDFWMDFDYEGLAHPEKGIIIEYVDMQIMGNDGNPKTMYMYSPVDLCIQKDKLQIWHKKQISDLVLSTKIYIRSHFWILDVYSCVNVIRDRKWFDEQVPKFIEFWNEVVDYRSNGGFEKLKSDISKNKPPPPKSIKIDVGGPTRIQLPDDYIMSSSDEEITEKKADCLLITSSSEDDDLVAQVDRGLGRAKEVIKKINEKPKKKKLVLTLKSASNSSNNDLNSDSDSEDTADSIFRPDPEKKSETMSSELSDDSKDVFAYFHEDSDNESEDSDPIRPTVKQTKAYRRKRADKKKKV